MKLNLFTYIPDYISKAVETNPKIAYLTICLAMFLENIIPPIPSEIINVGFLAGIAVSLNTGE